MPYQRKTTPRITHASTSVEDIVGSPQEQRVARPIVHADSNPKTGYIPRGEDNGVAPSTFTQDVPYNRYAPENAFTQEVAGYLDQQPEGHGFLRPKFLPSREDIYISQSQIRRFML